MQSLFVAMLGMFSFGNSVAVHVVERCWYEASGSKSSWSHSERF